MKRIYLSILATTLACVVLSGQEKWDWVPLPYRSAGVNMTPLLVQLVPFNRSDPKVTGPYHVAFRSFRENRKGRVTGFRWALGADLSDANDEGTQSFINLRMGAGTLRRLHPRWAFSSGVDLMISLGDLNVPGSKDNDGAAFGCGPFWGVDYGLSSHISLSIETALFVGIDVETGFKLEFIPPVAVYLNYQMPRRKARASGRRR